MKIEIEGEYQIQTFRRFEGYYKVRVIHIPTGIAWTAIGENRNGIRQEAMEQCKKIKSREISAFRTYPNKGERLPPGPIDIYPAKC